MADLKLVYAAPTEETALNELELFKDKWDSKYPKIYKSWHDNWATLSTYFKKYPYHEFDSIIKDYYDINLSATDLCNYIDSFKFLCDKFNIVEFDDCWYLYHKTN